MWRSRSPFHPSSSGFFRGTPQLCDDIDGGLSSICRREVKCPQSWTMISCLDLPWDLALPWDLDLRHPGQPNILSEVADLLRNGTSLDVFPEGWIYWQALENLQELDLGPQHHCNGDSPKGLVMQ